MFDGFGHAPELLLVLVLAGLLFGSKNFPALGKGLGEATHAFKQALSPEQEPYTPPPEAAEKTRVQAAEARPRQDDGES